MEELVIALLVGLWKLIVRAYEKIRDWNQRRKERQRRGPLQRPDPAEPAEAALPLDPVIARREALVRQLTALEGEANARSQALRRSRANLPLGRAVDELVVLRAVQLREEVGRVLADPSAVMDLERLTARTAALERFYETLVWMAGQREHASWGPPLAGADRLARACYEPLLSWARYNATIGSREPVAFVAERGQLDLGAFPGAGLAPIVLPGAFPEQLPGWAMVAHEVGRDFLDAAQGLKWELRNRFGLPDRYPIPFAFRGYLSEDEVLLPYGAWLEVLFGDLMGTLLLGRAYPLALMDLLSTPGRPAAAVTVGVSPDAAFYSSTPPAHLRMAVAISVLDDVGQGEAQRWIWHAWSERHGWPQVLYVPTRIEGWIDVPVAPFVDMAGQVADLMMAEPLGALNDHSLDMIPDLAFHDLQHTAVDAARAAALEARPVPDLDPRTALAGALLARSESPNRSAELLRWLRRTLVPERAAPAAESAVEARPAAAAGEASMATLLRDAIVLGEVLNRPRMAAFGRLTSR